MFKYINQKTNLYKLLTFKRFKNVKNYEKYSIIMHILLKKRKVHIGNTLYIQKKNYLVYLNKPIFTFNITQYPKSYPFKNIKS